MKKMIFVLIIVTLFSCKKDVMPYSGEFEKSEQTWNKFKDSINNSYSYINYSSFIFGRYAETKITVQNGKVTGRVFTEGVYPQNSSQLAIKETWTEDVATLNTHLNGAESLTLDEIYRKATKEWLSVNAKTNDIYFSTDIKGFIASCGYVAKGCQDDCFVGVNIKAIMKL